MPCYQPPSLELDAELAELVKLLLLRLLADWLDADDVKLLLLRLLAETLLAETLDAELVRLLLEELLVRLLVELELDEELFVLDVLVEL
jgi:hypothetical protein